MQRIDRHTREQFIEELCKKVPTATRAHGLRLLRWGATYGRMCEAECNGDYPYIHTVPRGYLLTCSHCLNNIHIAAMRKHNGTHECPSCRAERIIRETCESMGRTDAIGTAYFGGTDQPPPDARPWVVPVFQGDPRGHCVRLQIAGAALAIPTS